MMIVDATLTPWTRRLLAGDGRTGIQLTLTDGRGHVGHGDIAPLPGFSNESLEEAASDIAAWVADNLRQPWPARLDAMAVLASRLGTPSARFAVEAALLQLAAASRDTTVARLLRPLDPGPFTRQAMARDAAGASQAIADGFDVLKLKVARQPLAVDLELLATLRGQHPTLRLRVDANGGWDRATASEAVRDLAALGVELVEQPLAPTDLEGMAGLRGKGVAIAADEAVRSVADLEVVAAADAADVVVIKPTLVGGVFETLAMARRAAQLGMRIVLTHTFESYAGERALVELAEALSGPGLWGVGIDTDRCFTPSSVSDDAPSEREAAA